MKSFYYQKFIFRVLLVFGLVFLSGCGEGEVTEVGPFAEDGDELEAEVVACISKGTPWAPDSVDGRILSGYLAGDTSDWVEIAQYNGYSLIVRANYINIHSSAAYYGNPAWQYTAYGKLKSYGSSNVRNQINAWFNGRASGAADNLHPNAMLRDYTVQNNALKVLGTCNTQNALGNGLSLPGKQQVGAGNDVAFALSWSESANYLSRSQFRSGLKKPDVPSQADAVENYNKISIPSGRDLGMWLRSPGDALSTAGALANADGPTGGRVYQMKLSERGYVYPAVWVDSAIFDLPAVACDISSAASMPAPAAAMATTKAATAVAAAAECPLENNYVQLETLVNMLGGDYTFDSGKKSATVKINAKNKTYTHFVRGTGNIAPFVDGTDGKMYVWYPDFLTDLTGHFGLKDSKLVDPSTQLTVVAEKYGLTRKSQIRALLAMNISAANPNEDAAKLKELSIFAFEGAGSYSGKGIEEPTHPAGRYGAMVVVVKKGQIVYITKNASTLPDNPKRRQRDSNGNRTDDYPPTVNEGFYSFESGFHPKYTRGHYPALNLPEVPAMRWDERLTPPNFTKSTSTAINIHTTLKTGANTGYDDSAGCQIIQANVFDKDGLSDYDAFARAVGFIGKDDNIVEKEGTTRTINGNAILVEGLVKTRNPDLSFREQSVLDQVSAMLVSGVDGIYAIDRSMTNLPKAWGLP